MSVDVGLWVWCVGRCELWVMWGGDWWAVVRSMRGAHSTGQSSVRRGGLGRCVMVCVREVKGCGDLVRYDGCAWNGGGGSIRGP